MLLHYIEICINMVFTLVSKVNFEKFNEIR